MFVYRADNYIFFSDSRSLISAAFRRYNIGFHVVFERFCSSYACWVGGGRGLSLSLSFRDLGVGGEGVGFGG